MVKVFYVEEVRKIEQLTCEQRHICASDLMYQAGYVLTKDFLSRVMPDVNEGILVVANTGNNGGDALVVYQELKKLGYNIKLSIVGDVKRCSEAFKTYYEMIDDKFEIIPLEMIDQSLKSSKYLIDGIFGTGLKDEVLGKFKDLIEKINKAKKVVYSIDIPSGIHPDSGLVLNVAIKAKFTGVIGNYKLGNFLNDALDYHGEFKLLDIGLLEGYSDIYYLDYNSVDIKRLRKHNSHKHDYGRIAFIGSSKMPGAISLAAISALKSGIGLAEVYYDDEITRFNIEAIYYNIDTLKDLKKYDAYVFGPGILDVNIIYQELFSKMIDEKVKMIVDAGGLQYLDLRKKYDNLIITPHLGELSSLIKKTESEILNDPISHLRDLAKKGLVTLFKGPTTIIQGQRSTYLMQAKNHGLATAGSGDVLAGIISAFLVDDTAANASVKGAAVHMVAADYARIKRGEISMIASDIVDSLYKVWTRKR